MDSSSLRKHAIVKEEPAPHHDHGERSNTGAMSHSKRRREDHHKTDFTHEKHGSAHATPTQASRDAGAAKKQRKQGGGDVHDTPLAVSAKPTPAPHQSHAIHSARLPPKHATASSARTLRPQFSPSRHPTATNATAASEALQASSLSATPTFRLRHPFRTNFNDHFETSLVALQDVLPFVTELRQLTRPSTPENFTIYDPYYCSGTIVKEWQALGIENVLHENRDFYADIAQKSVPGPYDVLVTNPPFSEDHIWRLLDFLVSQSPLKPWAFVAPDYIASKPQYKDWVKRYFTASLVVPSPGPTGAMKGAVRRPPPPIPSIEAILPPFLLPEEGEAVKGEAERGESTATGQTASDVAASSPAAAVPSVGPEPFYLIPRVRYDYEHPLGVGHEHSHFKSMWYVWAGRHTNEVLRAVSVALSGRGRHAAPSRSSTEPHDASAPVTLVNGYQALVEGHYVAATEKRMNPERRSRGQLAVASRGSGNRGHGHNRGRDGGGGGGRGRH